MITLKQLCFLSVLAFTFGLLCSGAYAAGEPAKNVDDDLLRKAGLGTSAKDLLDSLQKWSAGDEGLLLSVDKLARDLDSDSFEERASAAKGLVRIGPPAATPLLNAIQSSGLEASRRALLCLKEINKTWRPELRRAAVRRIAQVASDESVESLLRFLPWAGDDELAEEIYFRLYAFAKGRPERRLLFVPALSDRLPARRAVAALILGRLGSDSQKTAVRRLLDDPSPMVRLRAAHGLLAGTDASGLPVLIDLLRDPSVDVSWSAEELLHWTAQADAPKVLVGAATPAERTAARAAWLGWWEANGQSLDWLRIGKDPRRPGLMFICTGTEDLVTREKGCPYFSTMGHIWLCGCDATARWKLKGLGTRSPQLLSGNKILVTQELPERTPEEFVFPPRRVKELDLLGNTLWQAKSLELVEDYRTGCHRLPNGITLIDLGKQGGAGPSFGGEIDLDGKFESIPFFNGWKGMPAATSPSLGPNICTATLRNGNMLRLRPETVRETTPAGKVVWEIVSPEPAYWVQPCLTLVSLGFDAPRLPDLDLATDLDYQKKKLKSGDLVARKLAIQDLRAMGAKAAPATLAITEICDYPRQMHQNQQEIESNAIGTLVALDSAALPFLWKATKDDNPLLRGLGFRGLGLLHRCDARITPAILAALRDDDNYVRYNAMRALQYVDPENPAHILLYVKGLKDTARLKSDSSVSVASWAANYLGAGYGSRARCAAPDLINAAKGDDWYLRGLCIQSLGQIKPTDKMTISFVLDSFQAKGLSKAEGIAHVRRACVRAVGEIGLPAIEALPMLVETLRNQEFSAEIRAEAAQSLGKFGHDAKMAIPALKKACKDANKQVSEKAIGALELIGG